MNFFALFVIIFTILIMTVILTLFFFLTILRVLFLFIFTLFIMFRMFMFVRFFVRRVYSLALRLRQLIYILLIDGSGGMTQ